MGLVGFTRICLRAFLVYAQGLQGITNKAYSLNMKET